MGHTSSPDDECPATRRRPRAPHGHQRTTLPPGTVREVSGHTGSGVRCGERTGPWPSRSVGSSGSTWAQRQAPGRPLTCSARATGGPSAGPTWSWRSWRRMAGRTPRRCWTAWRSSPGPGSPTGARRSRRWTSTPCWPASPRSRWLTSSRTRTCPARGTPSAGRTSRSCWRRASTSSPTSTSSTSSPSTTSCRRSPACRSGKPCRTPWSAPPIRSSSSTLPPRRSAAGWRTATSTRRRRSMPR